MNPCVATSYSSIPHLWSHVRSGLVVRRRDLLVELSVVVDVQPSRGSEHETRPSGSVTPRQPRGAHLGFGPPPSVGMRA